MWRSTESAPRDGKRIIGWFGDRAIVVFWREGPEYINNRATGNRVWYWSDGYSRFREPDAWQPEPDAPDAGQFPRAEPPPKPRGPTTVVASPAARRKVVEHKPQRLLVEKLRREWCGQCERRVTAAEAKYCVSIFCKLKVRA